MDNVVGTANILEYARYIIIKILNLKNLCISVLMKFLDLLQMELIIKRMIRYNSTNPYSATKAGGEELAVAYENTYNLPSNNNSYYECIWGTSTS